MRECKHANFSLCLGRKPERGVLTTHVTNLHDVIVYAEAQEQPNDIRRFVKFQGGRSRKQGFPQSDPAVLKHDSNALRGDLL